MRTHHWIPLAFLTAACAAPSGLEHRAVRANNVREAGSVHVAVLAVAPWSHYARALSPDFQLSADQARDLVVRNSLTSIEASRTTSGLAVSAKQDSSDAPGLPAGAKDSGGPSVQLDKRDRPDAMLEYWNAAALYQEVQLLNRTLGDAAIPSGHRAYLVRLSIAMVPLRRGQPYDAYTTLSFFSTEPAEVEGLAGLAPGTSLRGDTASSGTTGPTVLPLLVSDNLEASSVSRLQDDVMRLAFGLVGFPGSFATQMAADLMQSSLSAQIAGRDLNSLLTVARVSDNTLRVRIGAMREPSAGYAMVPRNHHVTLVLTVPDGAPSAVQLLARTELVDVESGKRLAGTEEDAILGAYEALRLEHGFGQLPQTDLEALLLLAQRNDQRGYMALLRERSGAKWPGPSAAQALWSDLVGLMVGSRWASAWMELPGHGRWDILPETFYDQTALLVDDGEQSAAQLLGARFAPGVEVSARLRFEVEGRAVAVPASQVSADPAQRRVDLVFPSLAGLGLEAPAGDGATLELSFGSETATFDVLYRRRSDE